VTPPPAVEISGLTKVFGGEKALAGVDLRVPEGSVFGFLGPNGAGKTTTLRILTGLTRPTAGRASVLGHSLPLESSAVRARVGFLPDVPGFYPWMTAEEFLGFAGRLFQIDDRTLQERVASLLSMVGLQGVSTKVGGYSRGMKQRLGIAQALINAPDLLLLDEPTSALDPIGRREVLDTISALKGRATVFFSTHILSDVERVCDTVAILDHGRVVMQAPIGELKGRGGIHAILVDVGVGAESLAREIDGQPWLRTVERSAEVLRIEVTDLEEARRAVPGIISGLGLALRRFEVVEHSLEDVFVDLIGREQRTDPPPSGTGGA